MRTDPEDPERRTARAKRGTMSPRPPKWLLWERVFPSDYKCSLENPVVRLDFPGCICSPMEKRVPTRTIGRGFENASGLGFWTSHPLHHARMVNHQRHVRPEPCEDRSRRARAKNRTRKAGNHEPTASQMVFVGTRFSIGLQMQQGKPSCPARFSRLHL